MLLAFIIAVFITLIPGLHINTISALLSQYIDDPYFYLLLMGAYVPLTALPLLLFNVSEESVASLPALQRASREEPSKAISYYIISALLSSFIALFIPSGVFSLLYSVIKPYLFYIVLGFSLALLIKTKRMLGLFAFILSALIGYISLTSKMAEPFLPMFSGFFAIPFILLSTPSKNMNIKPVFELSILRPSIIGSLLGILALMLPGISSPSVVAIPLTPLLKSFDYIALTSAIMSSEYTLSIQNFYETGKKRIGVVGVIKRVENAKLYIFSGVLVGSGLAFGLLRYLKPSRTRAGKYLTIAYLTLISFLLNGVYGILILALSSLLGLIVKLNNVNASVLLGSIIGTTLYYLHFFA